MSWTTAGYASNYGGDSTRNSPFANCTKLTKIVIPEGITAIPGYAFYNMTNLKEIDLPNTLQTIGEYAFYNASGLECINIGPNVTTIGNYAFTNHHADLIIYGESGSYAETYAAGQSIEFSTDEMPVTFVNLSGKVTTKDAVGISDVIVTLWLDEYTDGTPIVFTTDEDGVWTYDRTRSGHKYYITFSKSGYELSTYKMTVAVGSEDTSADTVIGSTSLTSTVAFSGKVITDEGTAVADASVNITDVSTGKVLALASTSEDGAWAAYVPLTNEVRVSYQAAGYAFDTNGITVAATSNQTMEDAVATVVEVSSTAPEIVSVEIPEGTIETCSEVTMTVQTSNATAVILVVDGTRYETYPVITNVATVTRAFSVGGERKVQFVPISAEGEGTISEEKVLNINTNGALESAVITAKSEVYIGEALDISWDAIPNAEAYRLRVYQNGSVVWIGDKIAVCEDEIPGSVFGAEDAYSVLLSAEGTGYTQSDTLWPVTAAVRVISVAVATPNDNDAFVPGDIAYLTADNPNGEYIAFRVTGNDEVVYLPSTGTVTATAPLDYFEIEETGTYTIEVVAYADSDRNSEIGCSDPVTIQVNGGMINKCNVGTGYANMLNTDITSLWCTTNNAVSQVNVYLDGASYATLTEYTEDASYVRTFSKSITSPAQGLHTFRFEAVGSDEEKASRSFTFYVMYPFNDTTKIYYPANEDVELIGPYPTSPFTGYKLNKYTGVTVHGVYGDLYYIKTNDRKGFVNKDQLVESFDTSTLATSLHLVFNSADGNHQYVPMSGSLYLDWYCDEDIGSTMYYEARFVNPLDLTDVHTIYTGTESSMNAAISNVPEGTYYIEIWLIDETTGKKYAFVDTTNGKYWNYERLYIVYDDKDGQIVRSDNDSCNRLIADAYDYADSYVELSKKTRTEYAEFIDSEGYQAWSWFNGDGLDSTQTYALKGAYLADAIMYSLSSKSASSIAIQPKTIKKVMEFLGVPIEVVNLITEQQIVDWFADVNAITYERPDGFYFSTDDPDAIKATMKQMQKDYNINIPALKGIGAVAEAADKCYSIYQDYMVYSGVSASDLQAVIDSLESGKDSPIIDTTLQVLKSYISNGQLDKDNILIMLSVGYLADYGAEALIDGYNKLVTEGVSSLATLMGVGPFMVGVKVGAAIAVPVVDLIGNINGIQEKTYRVLWALEAADAYYVFYLDAVEAFEEAPLANYEKMVEASSTFCLLYGNVAEALYKCWDEIQASPWQTFWNFCAGYDVNAAKENHKQVVQFYKNFLKQDCINFYQDFAKPSGKAYVEWGN